MVNKRTVVLGRVVAMTALALAGCNSDGSPASGPTTGRTYHFISHADPENPFWNTVRRGMADAATEYGAQAVFFGATETGVDPAQQQVKKIDAAVAAHVDGIALTMSDAAVLAPSIAAAQAANIPVIAFNVGPTPEQVAKYGFKMVYVGQDDGVAAGKAALHARDLMTSGGGSMKKALCIKGMNEGAWAVQRCAGMTTALTTAGVPMTTLGGNFYAQPPQIPEADVRAWLGANKDVNFIFSTAPAVLTLLLSLQTEGVIGSDVMLASVDLNDETQDAIRSGKCKFAVDQQPYMQGYMPIVLFELNKDYLLQLGDAVQTGPFFVDSSNVDQIATLVKQGAR
jgi:simple sugar transport system substrate-binding protein